ncbi:origin recognition complex subunit 1-like [Argiope bruennichi]|uniref:origin recognition complex subunit 1-like n=1 Tax=Argiope bruennichi TaxID=94029 RepID=UPI0024957B18|nr:origin recognition complex subunit 1-like [Argiope bruennichi]
MFLLWFGLIVAFFLIESGAHKDSERMRGIKKDEKVREEKYGEIPRSNDEIWFDSIDSEDEDYEILDVEEDNLLHPSDNKFLTPETIPSNDKGGMTYSKKVNNIDELDEYNRKYEAEDLTNNLGNLTYSGNDLKFRQNEHNEEDDDEDGDDEDGDDEDGDDEDGDDEEDHNDIWFPLPYTGVYDIGYATPEREPGEDRWRITPCVTTLRELYTCIFCSGDPSVRQQFLSCYELLPKRVKKQGIKCYSKVLKIPFAEGADDMDYYHYLCKKFKSIEQIVSCVASSLPELPKKKFIEEEIQLAKYSYCLKSINSRNCC